MTTKPFYINIELIEKNTEKFIVAIQFPYGERNNIEKQMKDKITELDAVTEVGEYDLSYAGAESLLIEVSNYLNAESLQSSQTSYRHDIGYGSRKINKAIPELDENETYRMVVSEIYPSDKPHKRLPKKRKAKNPN